MSDSPELNLARTLLNGRSHRDVSDDEILSESRRLFEEWMNGEVRMERPKVYDHYAMVIAALLRRVNELETRLAALETERQP
ncbi:hypothetical protein [Deinococcus ruber]|uniref:Uncharacterized protein n=1 Tax=Deinococcus ruber TaxID=1848197 RepID=A0A918CHI7_9DEIO|nr:hypothetical protein [Deinococcus ruber]GGR22602.1 hypothetical protein GCM10008957_38290 [Deinococcus ruber]